MFHAILIDPERQTVSPVETDGELTSIRDLVAAKTIEGFRVAAHPDSFDYGWVDETGLINGKPIYAFKYRNMSGPIGGRCLLLGVDNRGETMDAKFDIGILRANIEWLGLIEPEVTWDVNGNVMRSIVTYKKATMQ